jgi:hypothetical protein
MICALLDAKLFKKNYAIYCMLFSSSFYHQSRQTTSPTQIVEHANNQYAKSAASYTSNQAANRTPPTTLPTKHFSHHAIGDTAKLTSNQADIHFSDHTTDGIPFCQPQNGQPTTPPTASHYLSTTSATRKRLFSNQSNH